MSKVATLEQVTWNSPPLATFSAIKAEVEARLGPPSVRDLDSNGLGLFDAHLLRFPCGLELALWRFHLGPQLCPIDPAVDPCWYEVYSPEPPDLDHIAYHLEVPVEQLSLTTDSADRPLAARAGPSFIVMRTDDNANDVEVTRVTSRCKAEAMVAQYERRGHKQSYWIAEVDLAEAGRSPA
jgi:hypothetical protein